MSGRDGYVVGQVASLLRVNDSKKSPKCEDKSDKKESKKKLLESLFTVKQPPDVHVGTRQSDTKTGGGSVTGFCPPPGILHESLLADKQKPQQQLSGKKRKSTDDATEVSEEDGSQYPKRRRRNRRDRTSDDRTVFVGNLPTSVTRKGIKRLFKQFGKIETIRIRCASRPDLKIPKKLAVIKKEFHPERHSIAAYVVYQTHEEAQEATKLNGDEFSEGFHMRVDLASKDKQHDHQRSVFVGNLPFDAQEDDVWKHFQEYGEVENVRLVRDRNTSIGKGFGYVLFKDKSSVSLTLKFDQHEFKGRQLRIKRSTENPVKSDRDSKEKSNQADRSYQNKVKTKPGTRPKFRKPSNAMSYSFQGDKATKTKSNKKFKPRIKLGSKGPSAAAFTKKPQNFEKKQRNKSKPIPNKKSFTKKAFKPGRQQRGGKKSKA